MSKKALLFGLLFLSSNLFAKQLSSFEQITEQLVEGNMITVVVDNSKCVIHDPNGVKFPQSTVVTRPGSVVIKEDVLTFDGSKYTHGIPPLPASGLLQRASFVLGKDGAVNVVVAFFDAETNRKSDLLKDVIIQCHLGDGVIVYGS